jgi:hypothetical protein
MKMKTVNFNGKNHKATLSDWTDGTTTATIKIGKNEVLLTLAINEYGEKVWVKN